MAANQQATPSEEQKRDRAYKYVGYPGLSKWMASSNDLFLVRKFGAVTARSILYLQHQIAKKEEDLEDLDAASQDPQKPHGSCHSFDLDETNARGRVMAELLPLLERYHNLTNAFAQVKARPPANKRQLENLKNWFEKYPSAIEENEQHYTKLERSGDLAPIVAKPRTPLWMLLSKSKYSRLPFKSSSRPGRQNTDNTSYFDDTGIDTFANVLIVLCGLCFLFVPMWWLNWVTDDVDRLGIITGGIILFAICLSMAAGLRPFEILAGTAAYSAVLMVYLQVKK